MLLFVSHKIWIQSCSYLYLRIPIIRSSSFNTCERNSINKMKLIDKCNIRWSNSFFFPHNFRDLQRIYEMQRQEIIFWLTHADRFFDTLIFGSAPQINLTYFHRSILKYQRPEYALCYVCLYGLWVKLIDIISTKLHQKKW